MQDYAELGRSMLAFLRHMANEQMRLKLGELEARIERQED